jgi:hypothetical protein
VGLWNHRRFEGKGRGIPVCSGRKSISVKAIAATTELSSRPELRGSVMEGPGVSFPAEAVAVTAAAATTELSSRPELRTRISCFALLETTTYAALLKESRTQIIEATGLDRKSGGGAQWRDLRFSLPPTEERKQLYRGRETNLRR